ncbi:MAG: tail length tape-measure protein [Phage 67_12]|nr:MAG: tail length tape-measure protein [Phage 67_12]
MNQIHHLVQGTDAWHQFRFDHDGASEAAAMLGLSTKVTRSELLRMKHTGLPREFSDWVQTNVLDYGHEVEAQARKHFEALIGEDLYAVTYSRGRFSASCDGLTMDGTTAWEHKQWNEALARSVAAGVLPDEYQPQCQQVMMVTGADRLIFGVSDGTAEKLVHMVVDPDPAWFDRIKGGWAQFHADLDSYELPAAAAPAPVGKAPETLPALLVTVHGAVTASNLAEFKATALAAIRSVNRELTTDAHFADAAKAVQWCEDVESRIKGAKEHALSQTATIDALFKTMDDISAEARQVRLDLEKLVKARKESIRGEIVAGAVQAFSKHVRELNASLGRVQLPQIHPDFAGVIKGKRTVASLQDAVDTELARVKIEASSTHLRMDTNLRTIDAQEVHAFLFSDVGQLVTKAPDDLALVIRSRIADHEAKEAKRLEAERERIRAEEQAKAQRAADERARAERQAEDLVRREREAAEERARIAAMPAPVAAPAAAPVAPAVVPIQRAAAPAPANEPATLNLGAICARLGFTVTAAFLGDTLHIQPAAVDKSARLYRESQWPLICAAIGRHVAHVCELQAA